MASDKCKKMMLFWEKVNDLKRTIADILDYGNPKSPMKGMISCSFGIECNGEFVCYNSTDGKWKNSSGMTVTSNEKLKDVKKKFDDELRVCRDSVVWCRCIGGWIDDELNNGAKNKKYYVYHYIAADTSKFDPLFLNCAERIYYEWISECVSNILNGTHYKVEALGELCSVNEKDLRIRIADAFRIYMRDYFMIDIETITVLSSLFVERETCDTKLVFTVNNDLRPKLAKGIEFTEMIALETCNIKKIRKLMQMGQREQALIVCRSENKWQVAGLSGENVPGKDIVFHIKGHMVWTMEVKGNMTICYKCGEYVFENEVIESSRFEETYRKIFGKDTDEKVKKIFDTAAQQSHGTVLIVLGCIGDEKKDGNAADTEVDRLIKESTGTKMKIKQLEEEFVRSLTSIDGALVIDEEGYGYGFGMILDGARISGDPARGARYNSTRKYIKQCKDKSLQALGVVISEDKTIDIITTEDEFEEVETGGEKDR